MSFWLQNNLDFKLPLIDKNLDSNTSSSLCKLRCRRTKDSAKEHVWGIIHFYVTGICQDLPNQSNPYHNYYSGSQRNDPHGIWTKIPTPTHVKQHLRKTNTKMFFHAKLCLLMSMLQYISVGKTHTIFWVHPSQILQTPSSPHSYHWHRLCNAQTHKWSSAMSVMQYPTIPT